MERRTVDVRRRTHVGRKLALILAAAAALVAAAPALASTQPAAGAFVETPEQIIEERQAGGNTHIHLTRDAFITGTYSGIGHADQWVVIHADGTFNFRQVITFTGLACGQPTSLEFRVVGRGDFVGNTLEGNYTVIGPTDVGHGHGRIVGVPGTGGTYEGQVHCD
jgi:hypothetical protein